MMVAHTSFSLLCSSFSLSSAVTTSRSPLLLIPFHNQFASSKPSSYLIQSRYVSLQASHEPRFSPLYCTATEEIVETTLGERDFVDVGYVSNVHGLQGEIRVKHNTDFPDLRFGKPGRRWLRLQFSGKERILEVELMSGRGQPGDKSWIVKLSGFDSIDQAKELVGATFLAEDRPELEEGEFYSRDLVGVRVILKDTGEAVGTVVNVFNSGGNDLLYVMLHSSTKSTSEAGNQNSELPESSQYVWIPFVEAIVPDVDLVRGEMQITPPKGLLELNLRSGDKSKKERRLLDWKERKKFQRRLIAAKKKLCELEQQHVFHGFRYGDKSETNLLAEQIVSVNSSLLQQALKAVEMPVNGYNGKRSMHGILTQNCGSTWKISEKHLHTDKLEAYDEHRETGLKLISEGKVATVLMLNSGKPVGSTGTVDGGFENWESSMTTLVETLLSDMPRFDKMEQRASMPVILILPAHEIQSLEELFASHEYFGFSPEKVRFLEEEKLPVVSCSAVEQKKNKVLMKSPYAILQSPLGSGGVITALSSCNILEDVIESGVEYVELCKINKRCPFGNPTLFGFVSSCETDIGIVTFEDEKELEDNFHLILPKESMMKLMKQIEKLPLHPILTPNSHVELLNKKWVDVVPSTPNSYEFRCSIYDMLDACLEDKACFIEITE